MDHPNREPIKRAYDAFGRGDIPAVFSVLDKNIRWRVPGLSVFKCFWTI
jgi:ketosteroid isomerase-like protein